MQLLDVAMLLDSQPTTTGSTLGAKFMSQVYCSPLHRGSCLCTGPMVMDKDEGIGCDVGMFTIWDPGMVLEDSSQV